MAIAYVAHGTTQKVDAGLGTHAIPLPAGHAAGHLLFLFSVGDDNVGAVSTPAGWSKILETTPGTSGGFLVYTRLEVYYRLDDGTLGSSVNVTYSTAAWPNGNGSTMVWTEAYSGVDTTGPLDSWNFSNTTDSTEAQAHPQLTTAASNCWLLTLRSAYSNAARTFTDSVGTDAERLDDNFNNVHAALYDSNAALASGLQTQRTTTASGTCSGGSTMFSIAIKPAAAGAATFASAGAAGVSAVAPNASVATVEGTWGLCTSNAPVYAFEIDWDGNGTFEAVTPDTLPDISSGYGRDQERQYNPSSVGSAAFDLINVDRTYSPEYSASPLFGDLNPSRPARFRVTWNGVDYPVFRGRLDDYDLKADRKDRRVSFTFLDRLGEIQGNTLSTGVYSGMRTGSLIDEILNLIGWTGGRDIDPGATIVPFWWEEGTDALEAVQKLVRSEGPPSVAYTGPDGTFVFRDRHHRLLRARSREVQASFGAAAIDCASTPATGLDFTPPFVYRAGSRDIVNTVNFEVSERSPDTFLSDVWTSDNSITLSIGQTLVLDVATSDPFINAVTPVQDTDFTLAGAGTIQISINRTSGASAQISLLAIGGSVTISNLKLRAQAIPVRRTVKITQMDSDSVTEHGARSFPNDAPWANVQDAAAIANMILLHYAVRRPTVQLRVTAQDPAHLAQILQRQLSDRIHITNGEMGLNADFFIEKIAHTVRRVNQTGKPPVHSVVFGCEKDLVRTANPFTFDLLGAGFDDGVFDPLVADRPETVFIFDNSVNGRFDYGLLGT